MQKNSISASVLLTLLCLSCDRTKLYPVSGKITFRGEQAAGAAVFFAPPGGRQMNEHMIIGVAGDDGSFELVTGSLGKGAPPGEYDVLIEWKRSPKQRTKPISQSQGDKLKGAYADPRHARFHAVVEPTTNHLPDFDLQGR